jgi:hypothetical protein
MTQHCGCSYGCTFVAYFDTTLKILGITALGGIFNKPTINEKEMCNELRSSVSKKKARRA